MKVIAAVLVLLLCSAGFVCCADGENGGKDSTFSLILRELFKLQSEVNTQRSEIGKLRTEVRDLDSQKAYMEKKLDHQQTDISTLATELGKERIKSDALQKQVDSNSQLKPIVEKQQTEIVRMAAQLDKQQTSEKRPSASYIRWGRTRCDGEATTVYKGYAAGPHFRSESGSGSNYLCLHENPQWKRYVTGLQSAGSIFGVQYETWELIHKNNVFSLSNNGGQDLATHPGPCVMCNVPNRSNVIMIPARTDCPAGWYKEYGGYLISSYRGYIKSSYICWDEAPETAPGGNNVYQSVICHTEVQCGTLPCSTYINGRELTCVVCSK